MTNPDYKGRKYPWSLLYLWQTIQVKCLSGQTRRIVFQENGLFKVYTDILQAVSHRNRDDKRGNTFNDFRHGERSCVEWSEF